MHIHIFIYIYLYAPVDTYTLAMCFILGWNRPTSCVANTQESKPHDGANTLVLLLLYVLCSRNTRLKPLRGLNIFDVKLIDHRGIV